MLRRSASIARGLALAVSACSSSPGGDETSGSVATPSTAAARVTTSVPIAVAPTTTIPEPADDLSQLDRESLVGRWASDRAAAVQRISDGGWGVDDGVLRGPGGMRFDLTSCPDGWTDGGPDGETVPLSWWIEYHGVDPARAEAFLDWLGDDGLVGGKPIELVTGPYGEFDWEMNTAAPDPRVEEQVDRRLATDTANRALAVVGFRDWTATDGFQLLFDEACLPSIGRRSSQPPRPPRDGRLSPSPWIVPSVLVSHETTGLALAELSRVEFTGQRIALLVMDNEFGDTLAEPLLDLAAAGRLDVVAARHDAAAPTIDQEIRLLLESEPAVLIAAR